MPLPGTSLASLTSACLESRVTLRSMATWVCLSWADPGGTLPVLWEPGVCLAFPGKLPLQRLVFLWGLLWDQGHPFLTRLRSLNLGVHSQPHRAAVLWQLPNILFHLLGPHLHLTLALSLRMGVAVPHHVGVTLPGWTLVTRRLLPITGEILTVLTAAPAED